jgi:hypothetical protein
MATTAASVSDRIFFMSSRRLDGIARRAYEETATYVTMRDFILHRDRMLRSLLGEDRH